MEEYWDEDRDGELPDTDKEKRASLGSKLAEICEAKMVEEEKQREAWDEELRDHISELRDYISWLEYEKEGMAGKIDDLNRDLKETNKDKSAIEAKLQRKIEKKDLNAALLTGGLSALFIGIWLAVFLPRAGLDGGWAYILPLLSIAYGVAMGYAFYRERVRPQQGGKKAPWYERLDLRRLGMWGARAVALLVVPLLFIDDIVGFGPVVRLAPPGSFEHLWAYVVVGVGLALGFQLWASQD